MSDTSLQYRWQAYIPPIQVPAPTADRPEWRVLGFPCHDSLLFTTDAGWQTLKGQQDLCPSNIKDIEEWRPAMRSAFEQVH